MVSSVLSRSVRVADDEIVEVANRTTELIYALLDNVDPLIRPRAEGRIVDPILCVDPLIRPRAEGRIMNTFILPRA